MRGSPEEEEGRGPPAQVTPVSCPSPALSPVCLCFACLTWLCADPGMGVGRWPPRGQCAGQSGLGQVWDRAHACLLALSLPVRSGSRGLLGSPRTWSPALSTSHSVSPLLASCSCTALTSVLTQQLRVPGRPPPRVGTAPFLPAGVWQEGAGMAFCPFGGAPDSEG